MAELQNPQTENQTLVERAWARIQKVAEGNGLNSASFAMFDPQERVVTFQGQLSVSATCETASGSYAGLPRGGRARQVGSPGALQGAVEKFTKEFKENSEWHSEVLKELKGHESQGWGLEGAKVVLPERSADFVCVSPCPTCGGNKTLTCPQCSGRGTIFCQQCEGRGRELCWHCMGRAEDPQKPGHPCPICLGTRYAECRACRLHGWLPCPTCKGNHNVPCGSCGGSGGMTQEVKVTCGVETHFTMMHENLPPGLKRGLDRIGIANIGKGHGEIVASEFPGEKRAELGKGGQFPMLVYTVELPYAEMKVNLGGKKALISVVGKRGVLTGVPNFLDQSLKPWREKLHLASLGQAPLEEAVEARAIKDFLYLTLAGRGNEKEVRRLYPFGLSSEAIQTMLREVREAVKKATLRTRTTIALACALASVAFFFVFFMQGVERRITFNAEAGTGVLVDLGVLLGVLGASWGVLSLATRLALQRRFPNMRYAFKQTIGMTGAVMLGGIAVSFVLILLLAPEKPFWLTSLLAG